MGGGGGTLEAGPYRLDWYRGARRRTIGHLLLASCHFLFSSFLLSGSLGFCLRLLSLLISKTRSLTLSVSIRACVSIHAHVTQFEFYWLGGGVFRATEARPT